ncbi:hypothetical protein TRFO_24602 [Tritrichomonas foetus]|uniref:Secreted protein n=1 Tax=Tritrichomonas foetus TaxID=1144522 RepID=A0A1J4K7U4_9EUKA|nr:hypothetical protein TRFO_24602 [Tritrichomonas foetus]|eukprot:OHT07267.1 hypothetical protein TRFO_24602 [Tritrichomonas foetus]
MPKVHARKVLVHLFIATAFLGSSMFADQLQGVMFSASSCSLFSKGYIVPFLCSFGSLPLVHGHCSRNRFRLRFMFLVKVQVQFQVQVNCSGSGSSSFCFRSGSWFMAPWMKKCSRMKNSKKKVHKKKDKSIEDKENVQCSNVYVPKIVPMNCSWFRPFLCLHVQYVIVPCSLYQRFILAHFCPLRSRPYLIRLIHVHVCSCPPFVFMLFCTNVLM